MNKYYLLAGIFCCIILFFSCKEAKQKNEHKITNDSVVSNNSPLNTNDTTQNADTQKPIFKSCGEVVFKILTTSERYKKLTKGLSEAVKKNGGDSYGISLEGSPNTKQDSALEYSKTYDFNVHESYPDRQPVIARFTFDLTKKQLYEYNTAEDSLIPIMFNKSLLLDLDKVCRYMAQ